MTRFMLYACTVKNAWLNDPHLDGSYQIETGLRIAAHCCMTSIHWHYRPPPSFSIHFPRRISPT